MGCDGTDNASARKVAFVILRSHGGHSYLHDCEVSAVSGALRASGVDSRVFECILDAGDPSAYRHSLEEARQVLGTDYAVIVLCRAWNVDVVRDLRATAPAGTWVYAGQWDLPGPPPVDLFARSLHPMLVRMALQGQKEALGLTPGVAVCSDGTWHATAGSVPAFDSTGVEPDWSRTAIGGGSIPSRIVLRGPDGCPYRADSRNNPFFSGVEMDPEIVDVHGCSFCMNRGRERNATPDQILHSLLHQLDAFLVSGPFPEEIILQDQDPFEYLPGLIRAITARHLPRTHILLQSRADTMLRHRAELECAIAEVEAGGHVIAPFLVGVENFSQPELDRMNKGIRVETVREFLLAMEQWEERHPNAFTTRKAAFGFILFTPWTTRDDLRTNLDALAATRFCRYRGQVTLSKLRLYPQMPLYWKARADGLLAPAFPSPRLDNSVRYGYAPEQPWRFLHPDVGRACLLLFALWHRQRPADEVQLLRSVLSFVETHPDAGDDEEVLVAAFEAAPGSAALPDGRVNCSGPAHAHLPAESHAGTTGIGPMQPGTQTGDGVVRCILKLHRQCNNRCLFCHCAGMTGVSPLPSVLRKIQCLPPDVRQVLLSGGEPTIYPSLDVVLETLRAQGLQTGFITNARRLCYPSFTRAVLASGANYFHVSLHACDPHTHDAMVGCAGAWAQTVAGLHNLLAAGKAIHLTVNCVVTRLNAHRLRDLANWAGVIGLPRLKFSVPELKGRLHNATADVVLPLSEVAACVSDAMAYAEGMGLPCCTDGLPHCLLPREHRQRLSTLESEGILYMSEPEDGGFCRTDESHRQKQAACVECEHGRICSGYYTGYAGIGTLSLPVPASGR